MNRIILSAALTAAFVAATPAFAAPLFVRGDDEKVTAKVIYRDAELRTPAGAAQVARRIRTAARQVCGGDNVMMVSSYLFMPCQHRAIDQAIATLGAPLVADALGRAPAARLADR